MTYTKAVHLPVPPSEAFALITEPERLRRWMTVTAVVDLRAGGTYRWTVNPGHVAVGTYREVVPGKRVVFGWGWDASTQLPPDASRVTVTIEASGGGSLVTLEHDGLDAEQAELHAKGWDHYLARLERASATGDAGLDPLSSVPDTLDPMTATEAVLAAVQPVLRNLTPEDQPRPTPCVEFTCHELAVHLLQSLAQLGGMAGATVEAGHGSLEDKVSASAAQAVDAWRVHGLDGTVSGPGGFEMPASYAAGILPIELLLHGWDLAQGSGQQLRASDEVVAYVRVLAEDIVPGGRGRSFGEEVAASPDAGALERLAAFAGRTRMAA